MSGEKIHENNGQELSKEMQSLADMPEFGKHDEGKEYVGKHERRENKVSTDNGDFFGNNDRVKAEEDVTAVGENPWTKEFERIGNEMFRNELEALDSNIYKRLKGVEGGVDGLPDRIKKWIADGRLRYAYMSDETGEIFVGRAAEEKRAEDLKNGIDEAKYLEHVKNLDPGVFSAIRKSESMVDNLLSFGEKDGTTSSERKKKIIEAYKNRCKADVCDGFFDGAEVLDCPIRFASIFRGETTKADVLIDFTEAGHSVQDKRHERRRVNEMKKSMDNSELDPDDDDMWYEEFNKLQGEVSEYVGFSRQFVLNVGNYSHEAYEVIEEINKKIESGDFRRAYFDFREDKILEDI